MDAMLDFSNMEICVGNGDIVSTANIKKYTKIQAILLRLLSNSYDYLVPYPPRAANLKDCDNIINSTLLRQIEYKCYTALRPLDPKISIMAYDAGKSIIGIFVKDPDGDVVINVDTGIGSVKVFYGNLDFMEK
jgi:hypothetical protein